MITKPTKMLRYIYIQRDVCTMIIAFIIALCLNKCKLQAYFLGNCYKKYFKQLGNEIIANQKEEGLTLVQTDHQHCALLHRNQLNVFFTAIDLQQSGQPGCDKCNKDKAKA